ncbi:ADAMTS-like protein 2 isoform X2 [Oryzias latipes]|uniref:ADAMTS-like protein 2 isoform X2 n=1 Tax=Oryzias latipes TaxID=8090 RepID=UPI0009DA319C|nr:ADAMTS-like protein 2 isoform X2 [Oryzias latipes]
MFGTGGFALPACCLLLLPALPLTCGRSTEEDVFQWWGEWSNWSSCSRSCGGGVRSQERHCLIQRLSTTQNVNSSYCVGSPKQYQLCLKKPCPSPSVSFKQHQCSQFNSKVFGISYYQWIPLYSADDVSISNKPCDLQCTTDGGERQLLVPAHDGTFCHDGKHHGVCIDGICQPVGCDGQLYSTKVVDRCGKCGGNGTTCQRVTGSYRKAFTQLGYVFITNIPAGASDIQIIERHKTENILALSDEAGRFFFNGNPVFDNPQNFHVAGTVFKYRRPSSGFSEGLEYMTAQGPTVQALNVMYYNLNGKLSHITYQYTLPLVPHNISASEAVSSGPPHLYLNLTTEQVPETATGAQSGSRNQSRCEASAHCFNSLLEAEEPLEEDEDKKDVWEAQTRTPSPSTNGVRVHRPVDAVLSGNDVVHEKASPPTDFSSRSLYSAALSDVAPYTLRGDLHRNQTSVHSVKHTLTNSQAPAAKDPDPDAHKTTAAQRAGTDSNDVPLQRRISPADMYRWKVSAHAPCSSTCTAGLSSSFAMCVRYDGTEVDDMYCDSLTRPEPTHEFCSGKECPPRWETSGWSQCSRTCGEGLQYRTVRCWKMLSPGLDSSVYDSLCLSHDLHRPANRKPCFGQSCGPQWEVSEWTECSARCGSQGLRTRDVRCSSDRRMCNQTSQPADREECEGPPCDRRWTVSDWGPCSGACGDGRMLRTVTCRSSEGLVMSEEQCDQLLRPLTVYPCGDRDCAPHWVEQEWQQCNVTCGRGLRRRRVVCAGLERGTFREFPDSSCDPDKKPESTSSCFQRPCSKWFSTSWSQCSKTCGSGVQVREVKCYQGGELVTRGNNCYPLLKPETRQNCKIQDCPADAPASVSADAFCQDKPTANCALVLKVKLCSHWYYRQACCQACKTPPN